MEQTGEPTGNQPRNQRGTGVYWSGKNGQTFALEQLERTTVPTSNKGRIKEVTCVLFKKIRFLLKQNKTHIYMSFQKKKKT